MARAHFRFAIGPRGRAPGSRVRVGDQVTGTVVVETPKAHKNVELVWKLGWSAIGRTSDDATIAARRIPIARTEPGVPQVFRFDAEIPERGPISYRGELFSVEWWLEVSLDIPWAFDPDDNVVFQVYPKRELRIRVQEQELAVRARRATEGEVCPFCKDTVEDDRWACAVCDTAHHGECHDLYGRCTIPGCRG